MLRIAAVVALMATPASAGETGVLSGGLTVPGGSVAPLIIPDCGGGGGGCISATIATPPKTKCLAGWTLVDVGQAPYGTIHKCAAVGDLRDPE